MAIKVVKYNPEYYDLWNSFVAQSVNGTFLFHRDFMEYHSDRFIDYSLLIFDKDKLVAILPANIKNNKIYSHQGLTYGGLIIENISHEKYMIFFDNLKKYLSVKSFNDLFIKQMSVPYQREAEALEYDEHIEKQIIKEELNMQVNLNNFSISKSKLKHYRRSQKNNFLIVEDDDLNPFWNKILIPLLSEKYHTKPLHSLEEINYLKQKFPDNIKQYSLYYQGEIIAGITLFLNSKYIVKSQYGAASSLGKKLRAMDFLFIELIHKFKEFNYTYFDMGTATDDNYPEGFNPGLMNQKEELGCRAYKQNTYYISL